MPLSAARTLLCGPRYALSFYGVDNRVDTPIDASGRSVFAAEIFFMLKYYDGNAQRPIAEYGTWLMSIPKGTLDSTPWIGFYDAGGTLRSFYLKKTIREILNKWTHIYIHFNVNEVVAYQDGEFIDRVTFPDSTIYETPTPHLTKIATDEIYYFNGYVAFTRFYSRALSDKEVVWNFNHRDNPVRNGLFMWLHWDSIDIDAGKWYDKTVFANHGTIYGATLTEPIRAKARILSPVRTLTPLR